MNGMKSAVLILALIAGCALAVPSRRSAPAPDAPKPEIPEAPAKIEEAPKDIPKPPANETVGAPAPPKNATGEAPPAKKPEGEAPPKKPEEQKIDLLLTELPLKNQSEPEKAPETSDAPRRELKRDEPIVGAAKPSESAEKIQGDIIPPMSLDGFPEPKPVIDAAAEKVAKPKEEGKSGSKGGAKDEAKDGAKGGAKDEPKVGSKDGSKDGAKDATKDGAKEEVKDEAKEAKQIEADLPVEPIQQSPADNERNDMIDDMIAKLIKLKEIPQPSNGKAASN